MVCVETTTRQSLLADGGQDGGDEVGKALADAGAGLDHEMVLVGDGLGDGLGHVELLRPRLVVAAGGRAMLPSGPRMDAMDMRLTGGPHGMKRGQSAKYAGSPAWAISARAKMTCGTLTRRRRTISTPGE